jgi:hypothetical protein
MTNTLPKYHTTRGVVTQDQQAQPQANSKLPLIARPLVEGPADASLTHLCPSTSGSWGRILNLHATHRSGAIERPFLGTLHANVQLQYGLMHLMFWVFSGATVSSRLASISAVCFGWRRATAKGFRFRNVTGGNISLSSKPTACCQAMVLVPESSSESTRWSCTCSCAHPQSQDVSRGATEGLVSISTLMCTCDSDVFIFVGRLGVDSTCPWEHVKRKGGVLFRCSSMKPGGSSRSPGQEVALLTSRAPRAKHDGHGKMRQTRISAQRRQDLLGSSPWLPRVMLHEMQPNVLINAHLCIPLTSAFPCPNLAKGAES